jgi:DUF1365 family protein
MNSCMYHCKIMHRRTEPKKYGFTHRAFYFYFDLDEIDGICKNNKYISRNRFNLNGFYDKDHLEVGAKDVKGNIIKYVRGKGVRERVAKVMLLTMVRSLGYVFNPVSFYFCFGVNDEILGVVAEVSNTFREMKLYFISEDALKGGRYVSLQKKFFYVSPFIELENDFEFDIGVPGERINIRIDTSRNNKKILHTSLTGEKVELTNKNIFYYNMRYPWVTLKVILLIHMHGIILVCKRVPFWWKHINPHLQKDVLRSWKGTSNK